jgi:hypothetical protein
MEATKLRLIKLLMQVTRRPQVRTMQVLLMGSLLCDLPLTAPRGTAPIVLVSRDAGGEGRIEMVRTMIRERSLEIAQDRTMHHKSPMGANNSPVVLEGRLNRIPKKKRELLEERPTENMRVTAEALGVKIMKSPLEILVVEIIGTMMEKMGHVEARDEIHKMNHISTGHAATVEMIIRSLTSRDRGELVTEMLRVMSLGRRRCVRIDTEKMPTTKAMLTKSLAHREDVRETQWIHMMNHMSRAHMVVEINVESLLREIIAESLRERTAKEEILRASLSSIVPEPATEKLTRKSRSSPAGSGAEKRSRKFHVHMVSRKMSMPAQAADAEEKQKLPKSLLLQLRLHLDRTGGVEEMRKLLPKMLMRIVRVVDVGGNHKFLKTLPKMLMLKLRLAGTLPMMFMPKVPVVGVEGKQKLPKTLLPIRRVVGVEERQKRPKALRLLARLEDVGEMQELPRRHQPRALLAGVEVQQKELPKSRRLLAPAAGAEARQKEELPKTLNLRGER